MRLPGSKPSRHQHHDAIRVVASSVVIQYFITQTYTPQAKALVERLYQGDRLFVPEFCLLECANVLWKQVRFQGVLQTEAEQLIVELLALPFELLPTLLALPSYKFTSYYTQFLIISSLPSCATW